MGEETKHHQTHLNIRRWHDTLTTIHISTLPPLVAVFLDDPQSITFGYRQLVITLCLEIIQGDGLQALNLILLCLWRCGAWGNDGRARLRKVHALLTWTVRAIDT